MHKHHLNLVGNSENNPVSFNEVGDRWLKDWDLIEVDIESDH